MATIRLLVNLEDQSECFEYEVRQVVWVIRMYMQLLHQELLQAVQDIMI